MKALPTIHSNGTNGTQLLSLYEEAFAKLTALTDAIHNIEFNARDYYVNGPDSYSDALEARLSVLRELDKIRDYLDEHASHIYKQLKH